MADEYEHRRKEDLDDDRYKKEDLGADGYRDEKDEDLDTDGYGKEEDNINKCLLVQNSFHALLVAPRQRRIGQAPRRCTSQPRPATTRR